MTVTTQYLLTIVILAVIGTIIFYFGIRWLQNHKFKNKYLAKEWGRNKKLYDWMMNHKWIFIVFFLFLVGYRVALLYFFDF